MVAGWFRKSSHCNDAAGSNPDEGPTMSKQLLPSALVFSQQITTEALLIGDYIAWESTVHITLLGPSFLLGKKA